MREPRQWSNKFQQLNNDGGMIVPKYFSFYWLKSWRAGMFLLTYAKWMLRHVKRNIPARQLFSQ
jgi:hypothetical protein